MLVKDCMKQNVITISATTSVREAARIFVSNHVGCLPVVDSLGKLIGILHLRNLVEIVLPDFLKLIDDFDFVPDFGAVEARRPAEESLHASVRDLMQPPVSVDADSRLLRAFSLLHKHQIYDLPVVDENDCLVGIVSIVDISTAYVDACYDTQGGIG